MLSLRRLASVALLTLAAACSAEPSPSSATSSTGGGAGGEASGGAGVGGGDGGVDAPPGDGCACTDGLHAQRILVLSQDAEIWAYDPISKSFEKLADVGCVTGPVFSMAVDWAGRAWVLSIDSHDIAVVDAIGGGACEDPGYQPDQDGFGLFGMAFSGSDARCPRLFVHSYDGAGPFSEGPGVGSLGVIDPKTTVLDPIGPIDYDGGELAGTGDGRLFAFAGNAPSKLIEYDETTAAVLATVPLEGFYKTNASAFAFYGGDVFFFTEAPPAGCDACLDASCASAHAACLADPACADELACAIALGDVTDRCGGAMPSDLISCLFGCGMECLPRSDLKVSRVTRLDHDGSDGGGMTIEVDQAPIRIVGAGTSTCAPTILR